MPRLLVVHHTPSPSLQAMLEAVLAGAAQEGLEDVEVLARPALVASPVEVLDSDACVLGTPANIGYMSGALKHFFDQAYYPCLETTAGRPYGLYVHGGDDTAGAVRSVERITTGMSWRKVAEPVSVTGAPTKEDLEALRELAATVAVALL